MREVLVALNQLVEDRVIETYAIGGAVGAMFYIEAVPTEDVDAFVFLPPSTGGLLDLSVIYDALRKLGGVVEREYVRFGDWPLQVLPDSSPLVGEAIREAVRVEFEGVGVRVFTAEYLVCVALQTGRAKDLLRVRMFLEQRRVDRVKLRELAARFGLERKLSEVEAMG
jgi:hypothetical protein